jgi:hypothetical protein
MPILRVPMAAGLLWLTLLLTACSPRAPDEVRVRLEGSGLLLENRTRADIYFFMTGSPSSLAWVPASLPGNRVEPGRFKRWRIAPSERGQAVEVNWWHAAENGPDRVRKVVVTLDEPATLPPDEQVVRACVVVKQAERSRNSNAEAYCMKEAEDCLARGGVDCATLASGWQKMQRELPQGK